MSLPARMLSFSLALTMPALGAAEGVALTFDDLPLNGPLAPGMTRSGIVREVLPILKRHRLPPSYGFINAAKLEGDPDAAEALRLWVAGGQRAANHTYSHMDLHQNGTDAFLEDVRRNEPVLQLLEPEGGWHWFRYPYLREGEELGKRRAVRTALLERGYRIAQVTLDYEDYLWNTAHARCLAKSDAASIEWLRSSYLSTAAAHLDADREMARLVFGREIDHVLLLHLGSFSSAILPDLLKLLRQKGFTFVTLEQAQRDAAYAAEPDAPSAHGGSLLEQWLDARRVARPAVAQKPRAQLEALCGESDQPTSARRDPAQNAALSGK